MKTKIIVLTSFLFLLMAAKGQNDTSILRPLLKDKAYCLRTDSTTRTYTDIQIITNYTMNRLLRRDFSLITLGEEGQPVLGNYATLDIKDKETRANLNLSFYNPLGKQGDGERFRSLFTVKVDAGLNEGIANLFSNEKLNDKAGIALKWSRLTKNTRYINTSAIDCAKLDVFRERLFESWESEMEIFNSELKYKKDSCLYAEFISKAGRIRQNISAIETKLDIYRHKPDSLCHLLIQWETAKTEHANTIALARKHESDVAIYNPANIELRQKHLENRLRFYLDSLVSLETSLISFNRFTIQWWDVSAGANGEKYNLLDTSQPAGEQLSRKKFNRYFAGVSFNHFRSNGNNWFTRNGLFFKAEYRLSNDNNLGNATLKEVVTTATTVNQPALKREAVSKVNAFDVPFVESFSHILNIQVSRYLNEQRSNAFNLRLNIENGFSKTDNFLSPDGNTIFTPGCGYFISLLDSKDKKGVVNAEVFITFQDIFNANADDSKFYQRHQLGLKFGVPFQSLFLK